MHSYIKNVTFDCADPDRMSTFWAAALGYEKRTWTEDLREQLFAAGLTEDDLAARGLAEDPAGVGPRLFFQRVPEGKQTKNRVHLDVRAAPGLVGDARMAALEAEAARLVSHGATRLGRHEPAPPLDAGHLVLADPEGNEFCLD